MNKPPLKDESYASGAAADRRWDQLKGQLKHWWGMLTDEDLLQISDKRDQLLLVLNEKYGYTPERARTELEQAMKKCGSSKERGDDNKQGNK